MSVVRDMMKGPTQEQHMQFLAHGYKIMQTYDDDGNPLGDGEATLTAYRAFDVWALANGGAFAYFSAFGDDYQKEICRALVRLVLNGLRKTT